jgi:hypothetical protein
MWNNTKMKNSTNFRRLCLVLLVLSSAFPVFGEILDVSQAVYLPARQANTHGVYPVQITWKKSADESSGAAYHIFRSGSSTGEFLKITDVPIGAERETGGIFIWIDANPDAKPGELYYYRVWRQNAQGQGEFFSETMAGYGALSPEQYFFEYNKTIKSSHTKLVLMNKSGSLDKVGAETKNGTIRGDLSYVCRLVGGGLGGARVTMHYDNYADFYINGDLSRGVYFNLTGDANSIVNMASAGVMEGTVTITGMYPGKIHYDKLLLKSGAAGGGSYGVEPAGFPRTEINWGLGR